MENFSFRGVFRYVWGVWCRCIVALMKDRKDLIQQGMDRMLGVVGRKKIPLLIGKGM